MEENGQIVVDVQMDALIASLQELRKQYEANTEAIKNLDKESDTYEKDVIELTQQNKVLRQEISGVEKQIQNEIKAEKAQEGSLVQLRAQLANLNKQYDSMSGIERMGSAGQDLQKRIKALSDEIMNLEGSTGRWQRNVGNYQSALQGLSGGFKAAGLSTAGLDKSMKLLNANPIVLFLTAIVAIFSRVKQSFQENEQATMELHQSMAAFGPTIDDLKRILEALAKIVVNVVTKAINGLTTAIGWVLDKARQLGEFFGKDWDLGKNFRNASSDLQDLRKSEDDYIKAKRKWMVESAKIDREVAELREKASDKEQYNAKQRIEFLDRAIELETEKAAKEKEFAEWNLRNLQMEAARATNGAEANDKLAEAERAVIEADKNLADTKRALNKQRQAAINEINGVTAATKRNTEAVKDNTAEVERQQKLYRDKTIAEMQKAEDALNDIILDAFEKRRAIEETAYQRKRETLQAELAAEREAHGEGTALAQAYNLQLEALEEQHALNMLAIKADEEAREEAINKQRKDSDEKLAEEKRAIEKANLEYSAQIVDGLSKLMEAAAGDNEEMVRASKIVALAEVAIKQGVAIAEAIASSAAGDPYTYPLRVASAIASTIAAMATAIASINSAKFENGGVIGGFRGATMGRDNTYISARDGEMVLNAQQQRRLFNIANGTIPTSITSAIVEALQAMPAPVLEYSEFQRFAGRVATLNETQKLK